MVAAAVTTPAASWTPSRVDGPLTTTFTPDARCFERHYLQPLDGEDGGVVSFMAYDAYHPEIAGLVPSCGAQGSSRSGCYPPGDWDAPVFSPGLHCPQGWTTASASRPHLTWCCPDGLEFDHDTARPWCGFPAASSRAVVMTVDCTATTFAAGPGEAGALTFVGYGAERPTYVVAASDVVLQGGAVGIALVGNASSTALDAPETLGVLRGGAAASSETSDLLAAATAWSGSASDEATESSSSSSSNGAKIGGAVGAIVGALLLVALGFVFFSRYRNKRLGGNGTGGGFDELDGTPITAELGTKPPAIELSGKSHVVELSGSSPPVHEAPSARVYEMP